MAIARALFASTKTEWETPPDLFARLNGEFAFTLDVCATPLNRKCRRYFTLAQNALKRRWTGCCWMNPPYGREISAWIRKAREQSGRGATVVCLLPARTDTAWWYDTLKYAQEIRFLRGRLTFVGARASAPFPSAVVIFSKHRTCPAGPRVVSWDWRTELRIAAERAA